MSSSPPATLAAVAAAKKAMRAQHLAALRDWARANPQQVRAHSQVLCEKLFTYVAGRYLQAPERRSGPSPGLAAPLYICSYLPLPYEVDVVPFMEKVWSLQADTPHMGEECPGLSDLSSSSSSPPPPPPVVMMVPIVMELPGRRTVSPAMLSQVERDTTSKPDGPAHVPQRSESEFSSSLKEWHHPHVTARDRLGSALIFVEVRDAADLQTAFEVKGKYRIRELKDDVLLRLFRRKQSDEPNAEDGSGSVSETPPRRVLCCDEWELLFPQHHPPPGLVRLPDLVPPATRPDEACIAGSILVLAPGVHFSHTTGARLGKGGGFYDRFLTYLRARAGAALAGSPECIPLEVVGIGFDAQVSDAAVAVDMDRDAPVGSVCTPSRGVEAVRSRPCW